MDCEAFYNWACESSIAREYADIMRKERVSGLSMRHTNIVDDLTKIVDNKGDRLIPSFAAKDIVHQFLQDHRYGTVAIFWDIENVRPPRGVSVDEAASCLVKRLKEKHGEVRLFKTYVDPRNKCISDSDVLALTDCKVDVSYVTHHQRKEVVDKHLIVDALWYAQEQRRLHPDAPLPTICIVSGDSDFSPLISCLNMANFYTICVSGDTGAKLRSIHHRARAAYTWAQLGLTPAPAPEQCPARAGLAASGPADSPHAGEEDEGDAPIDAEVVLEEFDPVDDLREAILLCKADEDGRIRRSEAGVHFQRNSVSGIKFSEVVAMALDRGIVEKGGTGGHSWVKLVAHTQLLLMVVTVGPFPKIASRTGIKCVAHFSNQKGTAHRHVFAYSDVSKIADFTSSNFTDTAQSAFSFYDITEVDACFTCVVNGQSERLDQLLENKGYDFLLTHPLNSSRLCSYRNCNGSCTFIHRLGHSPDALEEVDTYSDEHVEESLGDLMHAIHSLYDKADPNGCILRGTVGTKYKGRIPFKLISKMAEERGFVELGGNLGQAWIAPLQ